MNNYQLVRILSALADKAHSSMENYDAAKDWFARGQEYARWTTLHQVIRIIMDEEYRKEFIEETSKSILNEFIDDELNALYKLDNYDQWELDGKFADELNTLEDALHELAEYRKKEKEKNDGVQI